MKDDSKQLTTSQLAERWGISVSTLQVWRRKGKGPAFVVLGAGKGRGNGVRYPLESVQAHERKRGHAYLRSGLGSQSEYVRALCRQHADKSLRQVAAIAGCDHSLVSRVRASMRDNR